MVYGTMITVQSSTFFITFCFMMHTVHILKNPDTRKKCCNYPKIGTVSFCYRVIGPKDADGMTNGVDPDQTSLQKQSDLGLHCLPSPVCQKT